MQKETFVKKQKKTKTKRRLCKEKFLLVDCVQHKMAQGLYVDNFSHKDSNKSQIQDKDNILKDKDLVK